ELTLRTNSPLLPGRQALLPHNLRRRLPPRDPNRRPRRRRRRRHRRHNRPLPLGPLVRLGHRHPRRRPPPTPLTRHVRPAVGVPQHPHRHRHGHGLPLGRARHPGRQPLAPQRRRRRLLLLPPHLWPEPRRRRLGRHLPERPPHGARPRPRLRRRRRPH